jgi:hypothetical protein
MKCAVHADREAVGGCCSCGRFVCPECKVNIDNQIYCNPCMEAKLKTGSWPGHTSPLAPDYTSGLGALSMLPPELRGWNWGAFLLTWIWGIGHNVWIALVALGGLIPYVGWVISIVMAVILGVRGNEWAWQKKKWDSIEQFRKTQRTWMWWGVSMIVLQLLLMISVTILIISLVMIAASGGLNSNFDWRELLPRT